MSEVKTVKDMYKHLCEKRKKELVESPYRDFRDAIDYDVLSAAYASGFMTSWFDQFSKRSIQFAVDKYFEDNDP